ncbi:MAG: hypothetical protein K1X74_06610 [Pirellulales bacterium]|nr:hypothetical protein [Pirellulales bacterium]
MPGLRSGVTVLIAVCMGAHSRAEEPQQLLLYVAAPGVRNYTEWGGAGLVVFDVRDGYRFVRRIETPASRREEPENIKGICAHAASQSLYFTTLTRLYRVDLATDATLYERELPGGCDRLNITPDGKWLYVPSLEREHWHVVDAATGNVSTRLVTNSQAHNTICSLDGRWAYLAGRGSPVLAIADVATQSLARSCGPFSDKIRPFTVNGRGTLVYVTVDNLLGFELGDLTAGKPLARVEVQGFKLGKPARHGCPSHGIALSPDEREIWVCDAVNRRLHVFDATQSPPRQGASIALREEPGWVSFSLDGRRVYASTGEVIDAATKQVVAALADEQGRQVHSEKLLEIAFEGRRAVAAANQFGVGQVTK